jgi:hypothetical protein
VIVGDEMRNVIYKLGLTTFFLAACANSELVPVTPTIVFATPMLYPTPLPETWIGDAGLVSGVPCKAPCFFGVVAGQTPVNQVVGILKENGVQPCVIEDELRVLCDNVSIEADIESKLVIGIGYTLDQSVSIKELFTTYGEPDYIEVISTSIPEAPMVSVALLYDNLRMVIYPPEIDGVDYIVGESTVPESFIYLDDTSYEDMKHSYYLQLWAGYGVYTPQP